MLKIVRWFLKYFGVALVAVPPIPTDVLGSARELVAQADNKIGSGEYKRAQVLRGLLNRHPDASESTCALAIELVVCGAV